MVSGRDLPRWTFSLYWRRDGKPIWFNPELIAEEGKDTGQATPETAKDLLAAIADNLGIEDDHVVPAYEDPAEWILKEGNLPDNVTPDNSKLKTPRSVTASPPCFRAGLRPLRVSCCRSSAGSRRPPVTAGVRRNGRLRRGHVFLVPGDSPVGYRLPLGSLPHVPASSYPFVNPSDPTEPRGDLPDPAARLSMMPWQTRVPPMPRQQARAQFTAAEATQQRVEQTIGDLDGAVRTAISVEPRDGRLCVFMPPVEEVEDYLELVGRGSCRRPTWAESSYRRLRPAA
jgi:uncharacterized protein (DUF2126 family)